LNTLGIFDFVALTEPEKMSYAEKRHYFWFGEVAMSAILAGSVAVPLGLWLAEKADSTLAFAGAALLFLVLFVFLPKIFRLGMQENTEAAIEAFGKNEQVRKIFWTVFVAVAGIVLTRILDPATAQEIVGIIAGTG
jgi:hypothetical protein